MKSLITGQQQIADYLATLGRLAYILQPNLGCLILAQHQFAKKTQQAGYLTSYLPLSDTGFPNLPVLNADLRTLYQLSVKHHKELESVVAEILKRGADGIKISTNVPKEFDNAVISANPEYLKAFTEDGLGNGDRLRLREENGWLYVEKYQRDPKSNHSFPYSSSHR